MSFKTEVVTVRLRADLLRQLRALAREQGCEIESLLNPGIAHVRLRPTSQRKLMSDGSVAPVSHFFTT